MSDLKDKDELLSSVKNIRDRFKTELADSDEPQLSFIDELNKLIRKIFNDEPVDVYTTLSPGELEKWKQRRFRRWVMKKVRNINVPWILYFILLTVITGFLISEAVPFYAAEGSSEGKTLLKALLTEICFIFLSGYRAAGTIPTILVGALRVAVFSLMLFVITSDIAFKSVSVTSETNNISEQIVMLEQQIKSKDDTIKFYRDKGWGVSVNKHEQEKNKITEKLMALKEEQGKGKTEAVSKVSEYQSYGRAAFRILLMLISVLITRRLFKF